MMPRIAVVDDDPVILEILGKTLRGRGFDVATFSDGAAFLGAIEAGETPDVAVLDIRLPGADGVTILKQLREDVPACRVVMMTAYSSVETMLDSLRQGAVEYLLKPVTASEVADAVEQSLRKRRADDRISEGEAVFEPRGGGDPTDLQIIMGPSRAVAELQDFVLKAARSDVPVLLSGETGTGKEVVAKSIHAAGSRSNRDMVSLNCGAIPETLVEEELFGHVKGSFTGAFDDRPGMFEAADGSTLFLDEVGELPLPSQVKLLRVLQENQIRRIGDRTFQQVDVKVIAASNRNLEDAVSKGLFRQDLYYRLGVLKLRVPPLRERKEDIPHLIERFLDIYADGNNGVRPQISRRAMKALTGYPWPGNVRELENEIARVVTLADGITIELKDLSEEIRAVRQVRGAGGLKAALNMKERQMIISCLNETGWNKAETARILGMSRQNLYERLQHHGIPLNPPDQAGPSVRNT